MASRVLIVSMNHVGVLNPCTFWEKNCQINGHWRSILQKMSKFSFIFYFSFLIRYFPPNYKNVKKNLAWLMACVGVVASRRLRRVGCVVSVCVACVIDQNYSHNLINYSFVWTAFASKSKAPRPSIKMFFPKGKMFLEPSWKKSWYQMLTLLPRLH